MLQIIDCTNKVHFDKIVGEKHLLDLINATVSHDMRNPIHSIQCQVIRQTQMRDQI